MPRTKSNSNDLHVALQRIDSSIFEAENELAELQVKAKKERGDPKPFIDKILVLRDRINLANEERKIIEARIRDEEIVVQREKLNTRINTVKAILDRRMAVLKQLDDITNMLEEYLEDLHKIDAELAPHAVGTDTGLEIANRGIVNLLTRILATHGKFTDSRLDKTIPWPRPSEHGAKQHEQLLTELADKPRRDEEAKQRSREELQRRSATNYPLPVEI